MWNEFLPISMPTTAIAVCAVASMACSFVLAPLASLSLAGEGHGRTIPLDGVIGRPSLWIAEDFWVLRFRLMVERGPWSRPQASEGEAQHGAFCWIGRIGQGDECLHCGCHGQDRAGSEGGKRT